MSKCCSPSAGRAAPGRRRSRNGLPRAFERLEVHELGEIAQERWTRGDVWWRRNLTHEWIERAVALQEQSTDLLLTEVVLGEVLAAPNATELDGIAACLVDCSDDERLRRIHTRAPDDVYEPRLLWDFVAWAAWLRRHAADPQTWMGPIRGDGDETWAWARWQRWTADDPRWTVFVLDTTHETVEESASRLVEWIEKQRDLLVAGRLPLAATWWVS